MIVLVCRVGQIPTLEKIGDSLESEQKVVGGLIEPVYCFDDPIALICNEEGLLLRLPFNRKIKDYHIFGDFFVCGLGEENFTDIPDDLVKNALDEMGYPPVVMVDKSLSEADIKRYLQEEKQ